MCSSSKTGSVDGRCKVIAQVHILTSLKQLECSFPTCGDGRAVRARLNSVLHASCPYLIEVPSRIQFSVPG